MQADAPHVEQKFEQFRHHAGILAQGRGVKNRSELIGMAAKQVFEKDRLLQPAQQPFPPRMRSIKRVRKRGKRCDRKMKTAAHLAQRALPKLLDARVGTDHIEARLALIGANQIQASPEGVGVFSITRRAIHYACHRHRFSVLSLS